MDKTKPPTVNEAEVTLLLKLDDAKILNNSLYSYLSRAHKNGQAIHRIKRWLEDAIDDAEDRLAVSQSEGEKGVAWEDVKAEAEAGRSRGSRMTDGS